jgi:hypothetical protein
LTGLRLARPLLAPWRIVDHEDLPSDRGVKVRAYRVRYRPIVTKISSIRVPQSLAGYNIQWGGTGYIASRHDDFVAAIRATGAPGPQIQNPVLSALEDDTSPGPGDNEVNHHS